MLSAEPAPSRRHYLAVVVSPHLDDAVFSCAATLARLVREGPVLVVNVFTRYLADLKIRAVVMSQDRYDEEAEAAAKLGFESCRLDALDAVFRRRAYRSIGSIFRPPVAEDRHWLPDFQLRLNDLLSSLSFERLLVPLGVGWHVDHVLCFQALRGWRGNALIDFYEDMPYALFAHALRLRLQETGVVDPRSGGAVLHASSSALDWWDTARQYARTAMMRNLRPAPLRWAAVPVVAWYLRSLVRAHTHPPTEARNWRWTAEWAEPGLTLPAKIEAMTIYRSQFREFFVDREDCRRMIERHVDGFGGPSNFAERLWRRTAQ